MWLRAQVCVTRGVEARASVLYMPEAGQWTYSIGLRLVPPGDARGFQTCQLRSRHWAIEPGRGGSGSGSSSNRSSSSTSSTSGGSTVGAAAEAAGAAGAEVRDAGPPLPWEHVRGEGVVGLFPVLRDGGHRADVQSAAAGTASLREGAWAAGAFVYQSCSGRGRPGGSFGGELTFVPGTLAAPEGSAFEVAVQPFALDVPDALF